MKESYVNQTGTNVTSGLLLVLKTVFDERNVQLQGVRFQEKTYQQKKDKEILNLIFVKNHFL